MPQFLTFDCMRTCPEHMYIDPTSMSSSFRGDDDIDDDIVICFGVSEAVLVDVRNNNISLLNFRINKIKSVTKQNTPFIGGSDTVQSPLAEAFVGKAAASST